MDTCACWSSTTTRTSMVRSASTESSGSVDTDHGMRTPVSADDQPAGISAIATSAAHDIHNVRLRIHDLRPRSALRHRRERRVDDADIQLHETLIRSDPQGIAVLEERGHAARPERLGYL